MAAGPAAPARRWSAIEQAVRHQVPRRDFFVAGEQVGSVASAHLDALRRWPRWIDITARGVELAATAAERDAAFEAMNLALREDGQIVAWRDERFPLFSRDGVRQLATFERAACRFWGTLTLGAHCNGYLADADGRPSHLWIARRAAGKATDPGKRDNLVGGGVAAGQTPFDALVREGLEEAGLDAALMRGATPGGLWLLDRDVPEGRQLERLHVYDLCLPAGLTPANQDGEVESIECLSIDEAARVASADDEMTVDAALVTLDFMLRHQLLPADEAASVKTRIATHRLRIG